MKNNRGFTLVELLAVIVILAILALIAVPNVSNLLNKSKNNMFCKKVQSIEAAAKYYAQDHDDKLTFTDEEAKVKIGTLLEMGYIKEDNKGKNDVTDPRDSSKDLKDVEVTIKIVNERYYGVYPLTEEERKTCGIRKTASNDTGEDDNTNTEN